MAARTATLWRLAQDWIDLDTGAVLCAAEDFSCAGRGAAAVGGRWNSVGSMVIYLADSLALAQLEKRVHTPMRPPRDMVAVEVSLPAAALDHLRLPDLEALRRPFSTHKPRILILYGSLRTRSFSRLAASNWRAEASPNTV